ncbi:MAG: hypothetical protein AAFX06_06115 [Planctomycetota bacterium]
MTPIDAKTAGGEPVSLSTENSTNPRQDAATLLLTLWAQQVDVLRNSLISQVEPAQRDQETLNHVTELMSKVSVLRLDLQTQELEAVGERLRQLLDMQTEQPSLTQLVNILQADFIPWAENRGINLSSLNLEEPTLVDQSQRCGASEGGCESSVTETPSQASSPAFIQPFSALGRTARSILEDIDAPDLTELTRIATLQINTLFSDTTALLENYLAAVQEGTAANDHIASLIRRTPGIGEIFSELEQLGHQSELQSLGDLTSVGRSLGQQFQLVKAKIQAISVRVQRVAQEIRSKSSELSQFDATQVSTVRQQNANENKSSERLAKLKEDIELLERLGVEAELLAELGEALIAMEDLDGANDQLDAYRTAANISQATRDDAKRFGDALDHELARASVASSQRP